MTEQSEAAGVRSKVVLDSIKGMIVTIGADGVVRDGNRAWTRFMAKQPPDCPAAPSGSNYFDICRWLTESDADQYEAVERGF